MDEISEKKKMTITIVGVVTFSETFHENFRRFNDAWQQYLMEAFPEFQPIRPPVTVTVDDVSPEDVILIPVTPAPGPLLQQEESCSICGKAIKIINTKYVLHVEFDSSHQATLRPGHPIDPSLSS